MRQYGPDVFLRPPVLAENLGALVAVLLGKSLVVQVVDQADDSPFFFVFPPLPRKIPHDGLYRQGVFDEAVALVVLFEKEKGFLPTGSL
jgi:hypothetical protein